MKGEGGDIHLSTTPLHLLDDIQTTVHNKLVHMPSLLWEPCDAIAALLRSAELILEKRIILRANNGKVVRHFSSARGAMKLEVLWGLKGRLGEAGSDWLRGIVLALIILERNFNVGSSLRSKAVQCSELSDLRTCYLGVFYGTLSPLSPQLGIWGIGLTGLRVQEDPMATVEIPESATTQTVTGC
jgi:hypothetical protein